MRPAVDVDIEVTRGKSTKNRIKKRNNYTAVYDKRPKKQQ